MLPLPPDRPLAARPWLPAVAGVVAGTAVVALGATGLRLFTPPTALDEGTVRLLRWAGAAAVVLGAGALLVLRRRTPRTRTTDPDPALRALLFAGGLMALMMAMSWWMPSLRTPSQPPPGPGEAELVWGSPDAPPPPDGAPLPDEPPPESPEPPEVVDEPEFVEREEPDAPDSLPPDSIELEPPPQPEPSESDLGSLLRSVGRLALYAVIAALVVAAARLIVGLGRSLREGRPDQEPGLLPTDPTDGEALDADAAGAGLGQSLSQILSATGSPRSQIESAYRVLLQHLARANAARHPWEAPHEHLDRTLGPLGVRPTPLRRLATLFVAAEFGPAPLTSRHRAEAVDALRESLRQLGTLETEAVE